jgi:glutamate---cysteine ligase / carboxylate-amine ligase
MSSVEPHPGARSLGLFEGYGIELEYMIVDADTLDVSPVCDRLLAAQAGQITSDVEFDDISWSNELALHVVELKTSGPEPRLDGLSAAFDRHVQRVAELAHGLGTRLMPSAMHPWMDPHTQMHLWPHEYSPIYEAMNRVYDCRGHGWSNLQSVHINLPFKDDDEFGRLHAAIRLLLPILPALAASSPVMDGGVTGRLDNRLEAYRHHCDRIPSVVGRVIPEPVFSIDEYQTQVLGRIYKDIAPHDPEGVLMHEFSNARGAIARFDRNTIEVRVIDVQECPAADLAIAAAAIGVLQLLVGETWTDYDAQKAWPVEPLADLFDAVRDHGDTTPITNADYLHTFGWPTSDPCTAGRLWRHLVDCVDMHRPKIIDPNAGELEVLLDDGPLARRIVEALPPDPSHDELRDVYGQLCAALLAGEMFLDPID